MCPFCKCINGFSTEYRCLKEPPNESSGVDGMEVKDTNMIKKYCINDYNKCPFYKR